MKRLMQIIALFVIATLLLILFSCNPNGDTTKYIVGVKSGKATSRLWCDSFYMVSDTEIFVWNNGTECRVVGDQIIVGGHRD